MSWSRSDARVLRREWQRLVRRQASLARINCPTLAGEVGETADRIRRLLDEAESD